MLIMAGAMVVIILDQRNKRMGTGASQGFAVTLSRFFVAMNRSSIDDHHDHNHYRLRQKNHPLLLSSNVNKLCQDCVSLLQYVKEGRAAP
jgi:hypothetical protein